MLATVLAPSVPEANRPTTLALPYGCAGVTVPDEPGYSVVKLLLDSVILLVLVL